jgi:hypothetical protein
MNTTSRVASARRERYTCRVERDPDGRILAVTLDAQADMGKRTVQVNSRKVTRVAGAVHDIMRAGGVSGRRWSSAAPIELDYLTGAQLELLLVAIRPVRRADRIDHIAAGVAAMSAEEASYWHAKLHRPGGLPALRVLLGTVGAR